MAKKYKAVAFVEYALARSALSSIGYLPEKAGNEAARFWTRLAYRLVPAFKKVGMRNLEIAFPDLTEKERQTILDSAIDNLARVFATTARMFEMPMDEIRELVAYKPTAEFASAYQASMDSGRGRIMVSAHFGNWELHAAAYPLLFEPFAFLARRMDNPLIDAFVLRARTRSGNTQIDKANSARTILSVLRNGGVVGVLADVNSHPKEGVFVPFFGVDACTASGVAMLALRANATIVPMWTVWDAEIGKYRIVHDDIIEPIRTGDREADIIATTALYVAATERIIRKYPDQWIWVHRRWKTRPPGQPDLY